MSEAILPFDPAHPGTGRKATGGRQLQAYRMSEAFNKFADADQLLSNPDGVFLKSQVIVNSLVCYRFIFKFSNTSR